MKQKQDPRGVAHHTVAHFFTDVEEVYFCQTCDWFCDFSQDLQGDWDTEHYKRGVELREQE